IIEGNVDHTILGDLGSLTFFQGTLLPVLFPYTTLFRSVQGGLDQITTGSGNDVVVGGYLRDIIGAGAGDNIVAGDSADIEFVQGTGALRTIISLAPSFAGDDDITTGTGADVIVGGGGKD